MRGASESSGRHVAAKWVTWLLLLFGLSEVPWVVYLLFFQPTTMEAYHLRLTGAGLRFGVAAVSACAAVAAWRRMPRATMWTVSAAAAMAMLTAAALLSPGIQANGGTSWRAMNPLLGTIGTAAAIAASVVLLRTPRAKRSAALVTAVVVLGVLSISWFASGINHLMTTETTELASHARAIVVVLDIAESIGLIGAGWASLRGHVRATLVFGTMAATLLIIDAYTNVVTAEPGPTFWAALVFLFIGEVPSTILALIAAFSAARVLPHIKPREPEA